MIYPQPNTLSSLSLSIVNPLKGQQDVCFQYLISAHKAADGKWQLCLVCLKGTIIFKYASMHSVVDKVIVTPDLTINLSHLRLIWQIMRN